MLHFFWITAIIGTLYLYIKNLYSRFSRHGVKYITAVPLVGTITKLFFEKEHVVEHMDKLYRAFPEERFFGRLELMKYVLEIKDIELIKQISVKNFEHFLDRRNVIDEHSDPLFGRNLLSMKGQVWKDMRSTLSPAFTSSKIRLMVPFMVKVGEQMIKALKDKTNQSKAGYIDVDVKDLTTRYANDVIASCAFGVKVDSHTDIDNQFYANVKKATTFTVEHILKFIGLFCFPKIMKKHVSLLWLFSVSLFSDASKNFFRTIVLSSMKEREEKKIIRPDMIHLLMEAKKGKLTHEERTTDKDVDAGFATVEESQVGKKHVNREWSDDDLVAQAVLFFIAGFETVSTAMSFLLHELAINTHVQDKLYQEIMENEEKNGGNFDYNSIQSMQYMDMVVTESLRLWPPVVSLERICIKDFNCGKPNDKAKEDFILRKGDGVNIPVWSIHRDADYFPDPLKFDPERFSNQNKHNIKPFTYMPFGLGPRNCIGTRFALCEVKVITYQLLKEMELSPAANTQIPVKLSKNTFNIKIEGGHWVRMSPRA